jgi:small subunit ribosomal protein S1
VGDEVEVLIVSIDKENRRMSLSIKQLEQNPWESVEQQFKIGDKVKGKISNITDFGVFVQIMPGIDGLVHISDLSWTEHIDHPRDRYQVGEEVQAVVLGIDKENKKISLGIKQLAIDPWENVESEYPMQSIINGDISKITNFGAFVKLPNGIEGLVHNTVLAEEEGKKAEEVYKPGEKHQFRVININKKERKLGLSTKLEATAPAAAPVAAPKAAPKREKAAASEHPVAKEKAAPKSSRKTEQSKVKGSLQMALEAMQDNKNNDSEDK